MTDFREGGGPWAAPKKPILNRVNPSEEHPERVKKTDKKIAKKLDYNRFEFPVEKKDFSKIEVKNNVCINVFGYENGLAFQFKFQIKNLKTQ